ncbi:hypothetical protein B0A55_03004 [Friedmanniomyces simplex]|uniref:Uncharacterized protein n=1 Tax=Friedmanniomyces simplex TaxID=329884 RepID=A0A4V6WLB5_9PEZI|nr:hypothetical protein B0A55_03004 [Friedmanniomyces simplex]
MAQSLGHQSQRGSDSEWESEMGSDDDEDEEFERAQEGGSKRWRRRPRRPWLLVGHQTSSDPPSYGQGYLAGTWAKWDEDVEDLQNALELSMQDHGQDAEDRYEGGFRAVIEFVFRWTENSSNPGNNDRQY